MAALGVDLDAIRAVLVTHHHVDHAGTAERLRSIAGTRVFCGERDSPKVGGERPSHPPRGFYRQVWRPSMIAYLAHTVAKGGARYHPVARLEQVSEDQALQLPGRPRVIQTPGHTAGHYSVGLAERGVLFSGDAMVNFDYASGRRGLALHRFNEDRRAAQQSLARLEAVEAEVVLFGHGDPWTGGTQRAVEIARSSA